MQISGLITGTLGYELKREFISNSFALRDVQVLSYDIYSVDMLVDASTIQTQIQNQFSQVYSGDVHVTVFNTQNTYSFPSDSLKASKFRVSIEIKSPVANLNSNFPELTSGNYAGLDINFWNTYGQYLLDFKEGFNFATNPNGNREFNHEVSFGLQTGWTGDNTTIGRKTFAQGIVNYIFSQDNNTPYGLYTMVGQITNVGNSGTFRNYYNESYDLIKNDYSFLRKREELPFDDTNIIYNLANTISMATDGTIDVSEKASTFGKISFSSARDTLDNYLSGSFVRCSGVYNKFYNTNIIAQDSQYSLLGSGLLPLINTPTKTIKSFDELSLSASYDVYYTNNPNFSGDGTITSQTLEFDISSNNSINATHTFDYTVNRINNDSGYFINLWQNTTGNSPSIVGAYYTGNFPGIASVWPNMNLIGRNSVWPNVKTKGSVKMSYSNNPSYFITTNGQLFNILDSVVTDRKPNDIVNEYKIVNRPTQTSVLSYGYQSEKGSISIEIKSQVGKQTQQFWPDGSGSFATINGTTLSQYLQSLYQYAGQVFLSQFNYPTVAFNWFIEDSKFSFDSEGHLTVDLEYTYTLKKRIAGNYP